MGNLLTMHPIWQNDGNRLPSLVRIYIGPPRRGEAGQYGAGPLIFDILGKGRRQEEEGDRRKIIRHRKRKETGEKSSDIRGRKRKGTDIRGRGQARIWANSSFDALAASFSIPVTRIWK